MKTLHFTVSELEELLRKQKIETAGYITRNLSVYDFYRNSESFDLDTAKNQLREECRKSPFPEEFNTLKKFVIG